MNRFMTLLLIILLIFTAMTHAAEPTLKDVLNEEDSTKKTDEEITQNEAKAELLGPADDYDRITPRSSVQGFLDASRAADFERAVNYLDLRYLPYDMYQHNGPEYARKLQIALDRALWLDLTLISNDPKGHDEGDLMTIQDRIARLELGGKKVDILMQRVPREDGIFIWKISSATVEMIPELYKAYGYGQIGEKLAKALPRFKFLDLELWQWIMAIGLLLFGFIVAYIPTKIAYLIIKRTQLRYRDQIASLCSGPIRLLIMLFVANSKIDIIHPTVAFKALMRAQTIFTITFIWFSFGLIGLLRDYLKDRFEQQEKRAAAVLLRPAASIMRICIVVAAFMIWFENMGLKATTVLTGLGLGGLAIALATQKSIENLIGAITLYATTPVKVGDFCKFGESKGIVEDIGLRYTRVRTLGRTVIHIPNASFVEMHLEAFSYREKILFSPVIKISRSAGCDQIRYLLVEIRKMLYSHPMVDSEPARVRFKEFGDYSLDIHVFAYIKTKVYSEYLEISEDLNLRIMDIVDQSGASLAMPAQDIRYSQTPAPNEQQKRNTEETIKQWRHDQQLYLPTFPEEKINELNSTIPYPEEGTPPLNKE